jgi:hypothetical protein
MVYASPPGIIVLPWGAPLPPGTTGLQVGPGGPGQNIECHPYSAGYNCGTVDVFHNMQRPGW